MTKKDSTACELTLLTSPGVSATKTYSGDAENPDVESYGRAKNFTAETIKTERKGEWLKALSKKRYSFVVLGEPVDWKPGEKKRRLSSDRDGDKATLKSVPRILMPFDMDHTDFEPWAEIDDGEMFALELLERLGIKGAECTWHLTSGHGFFNKYRCRLWVRLAEPATPEEMHEYARERWGDEKVEVDGVMKNLVDYSVYQAQQPIYTADPILLDGIESPVRNRVGYISGDALVRETQPRKAKRPNNGKPEDGNIELLTDAGLYIDRYKPGQHCIECPWEDEHSGESRRDDTFYFEPNYNGHDIPAFKCHHDSCGKRKWHDVLEFLGEPVERADTRSSFTPVSVAKVGDDDLGLITITADKVEPERIEWLWPNRFAKGKLAMIAGHPGCGKSQITCDIVARITTGREWAVEGGRAPKGSVLMLSAEDAVADTIVPRLMAAGADLGKVRIIEAVRAATNKTDAGIEERGFDLTKDIPRLEEEISKQRVVLIVIDPVTAYGGVSKLDWNSAGDVRGFLKPLSDLATKHKVAVVLVHHFRKAAQSGEAQLAVLGSVGMSAAVRSLWLVMRDSDDDEGSDAGDKERMLFLFGKSNIGPRKQGLAYTIESATVGDKDIPTSHVVWETQLVDKTANDVMQAANGAGRHKRQDAVKWLRDLLSDKPMLASEVEAAAEDAGYSMTTVKRAKGEARVISRKGKKLNSEWTWSLIGGPHGE